MSEVLTIRLNSVESEPIQWLVWSQAQGEVIASGELNSTNELSQLSSYATQRQVVALMPSCDVLLTNVSIPVGAPRNLTTILPYLLEDELVQDIADLHFSLINKEAGVAHVAVVQRHKLESWLAQFEQAGLSIKKIIPDCLALPFFAGGLTIAAMNQQWLVRSAVYQGTSIDYSLLEPLLQSLENPTEDNAEDWVIHTLSDMPSDRKKMPVSATWQAESPELIMEVLAKGALNCSANLLSGQYKNRASWHVHWTLWKPAVIAACLLLVILFAQHVITIQKMEDRGLALRAESERIFREVFPNKRKIPTTSYLKSQMNAEESRLKGEGGFDALSWLNELHPYFVKVPTITIISIKYDGKREELRIQAQSRDFQSFEKMGVSLKVAFDVEQGQLNKTDNVVNGSFVIRRQR
ncbi:MAG: type II secretion system protein GspL [Aliivibrio sp.]|uniref:type II secretion system protein GspL n=1 Tax=Aliivibrio sp. TaxID=1872443 RepID=UPI001A5E1C32|nr:type II secretion system protein GspL [Aliivibrio sp.]